MQHSLNDKDNQQTVKLGKNRKYQVSQLLKPSAESPLQFILTDCPAPETLYDYILSIEAVVGSNSVTTIVRVCESSAYDAEELNRIAVEADGESLRNSFNVVDQFKFEDGGVPTNQQAKQWIQFLVDYVETCASKQNATSLNGFVAPCIAVHCASGIGRAPLLVALAFIESGIDSLDVIAAIRKLRRGAFNNTQVRWLDKYSGKRRLNKLLGNEALHSKNTSRSLLERLFSKFGKHCN